MKHDYRGVIVDKPWGFEYLAYENSHVALWVLHIAAGERTSLHCHPTKTTGLVLLQGVAELSFLTDSKLLEAPHKEMIRRGLFHSTRAVSEKGVILLEVETPNDKADLVRLSDAYGRGAQGYEKSDHELPRPNGLLWIDEPDSDIGRSYTYADQALRVERIVSPSDISVIDDGTIMMFLNGGLTKSVDGRQHYATVPGDVGIASVVKRVASEMEAVAEDTTVLCISKRT
jgi:hypothetical protein